VFNSPVLLWVHRISLDGFFAGPDDTIDWIIADEQLHKAIFPTPKMQDPGAFSSSSSDGERI